MRAMPWTTSASARTWLAASDGWTLSQNTYWVALEQVPGDFGLHNSDVVSSVPVPQQPLLASRKPAKTWEIKMITIYSPSRGSLIGWKNMVLTMFWWGFKKIIERSINVEDNNCKTGIFLLEICCSWVDLLIESLGVRIDSGDAPILMISQQRDC